MTEEELWRALNGLMAYDLGATDSGIHDEELRERVKTELRRLDDEAEARRKAREAQGTPYPIELGASHTLSRYLREYYLTDECLAHGYSIEDAKEFIDWLANEMDYYV